MKVWWVKTNCAKNFGSVITWARDIIFLQKNQWFAIDPTVQHMYMFYLRKKCIKSFVSASSLDLHGNLKADEVVAILVLKLPPVMTTMMVMVTMMIIPYKDVLTPPRSHFKPQPSILLPQIYGSWTPWWIPSEDLNGGEEVLDGDLHVVHKSLTLLYRAITWMIRSNHLVDQE